jgi:hypothetical protein
MPKKVFVFTVLKLPTLLSLMGYSNEYQQCGFFLDVLAKFVNNIL